MEDYKKFLEDMKYNPKQLRAIRAIRRFRAIVRRVIANLFWLQTSDKEELTDNVRANLRIVQSRVVKSRQKNTIENKDRRILCKQVKLRTKAEKTHLGGFFSSIPFFKRYPEHVKRQLAGMTLFEFYGPGRVIMEEGQLPVAMYFILNGEVLILRNAIDPITKEKIQIELSTLGVGGKFGDVSLLHNIPRTATVVTQTNCELLRVEKDDFMSVLKETIMKEWDKIINSLKSFAYFDTWDEMSVREFCIIAKLKSFKAGETVLGDMNGLSSHTYFVIKGKCKMIEQLFLRPYFKFGAKHYRLYKPKVVQELQDGSATSISNSIDTPNSALRDYKKQKSREPGNTELMPGDVEAHFMQVCIFDRLSCFNLGESLQNRRIIAINEVETISVPLYVLLQNNKNHVWNKVKNYLTYRIPNTRAVFEKFVRERTWHAHKKQILEEMRQSPLLGKIHESNNTINNVPYSIRIKEEFYK